MCNHYYILHYSNIYYILTINLIKITTENLNSITEEFFFFANFNTNINCFPIIDIPLCYYYNPY